MKQKAFKTMRVASSTAIGNEIYIYEANYPEHSFPMHWHDYYEFEIILDGAGEIICNNKSYPIKPGMVSFVTPLDFHEIHMKNKVHELCIQFSPGSISKEVLSEFQNVKNPIFYCSEEETDRTRILINLLKNNTIQGLSGNEYLSRILESILISFKNEFETSHSEHEQSPTSIQKALLYMHSHFKENPKMGEVAKMLYLNENYFCTLFKEHIGETYKDYLKKLKLEHAKKLIINTDIPLTQISLECGYYSHSNFNRDFKKFFGFSPSEMRDN